MTVFWETESCSSLFAFTSIATQVAGSGVYIPFKGANR